MRKPCLSPFVALVFACAALNACAAQDSADWPQWRGPNRDGVSPEKDWSWEWPKDGPQRLWTANVGAGCSSVSVAKGRVYTMGNEANKDSVFCLDADKGAVLWKHTYDCAPGGEFFGPRCTPTVAGGHVFATSREGRVFCLDAEKGGVLWAKDLKKEFEAKVPYYGLSTSPLVEGGLVICMLGGKQTAVVAFKRDSGELAWKGPAAPAGYASPLVFGAGASKSIAVFTAAGLSALNPATGEERWLFPWKTHGDINAADPICSNGKFFLSTGYKTGCVLVDPSGGKPVAVWQSKVMSNHYATCVLLNGFLYGFDGHGSDEPGALKCIEFKSGAEKWSKPGCMGTLILAHGKLLVFTRTGRLLVVDAAPDGYKELASADLLPGPNYTAPALCSGRLYLRNSAGDLVCLDLSAPKK